MRGEILNREGGGGADKKERSGRMGDVQKTDSEVGVVRIECQSLGHMCGKLGNVLLPHFFSFSFLLFFISLDWPPSPRGVVVCLPPLPLSV